MADYLYIHIPFCHKKCYYCDFYSVNYDSVVSKDYIDALKKEILMRNKEMGILKSIYIGGGTPTVLDVRELSMLLESLNKNFSIKENAELTIESNPNTINLEKLSILKSSGVNRISLGVQSLIDRDLRVLGRIHNSIEARKAIEITMKFFENVSIDLIYGIPEQTIKDWEYSISMALTYKPAHISAYELTPEDNTVMKSLIFKGDIKLLDEEEVIDMYGIAIDRLTGTGYHHYEISNFSMPDYECRHNLNYWMRGEYIGLGPGAHSFIDEKRFSNVKNIDKYIASLRDNALAVEEVIELTNEDKQKEYIFLGLRKTEGIDMNNKDFNLSELNKNGALDELIKDGLIEVRGGRIRLTRRGLLLSNQVINKIIESVLWSFFVL